MGRKMKPFAYAVVSKECFDDMENMSLQFNEPVDAKKVIPLYERPIDVTDEEIEQIGKETMLLQFFQTIEATADHGDSIARAMTAMIRQQAFDFARAILRKAQEK